MCSLCIANKPKANKWQAVIARAGQALGRHLSSMLALKARSLRASLS